MNPTLEKLFADTAGQSQFKDGLAAGIKMSIGNFYKAKREWLAAQSPSGSAAEETPDGPDDDGAEGNGERPSSTVPEATAPTGARPPQKGGKEPKRPALVLAGDQLFFTIPVNFRPEVVALYNSSRELGLSDNLSTWVNSCIEGYYEDNGMGLTLLYGLVKEVPDDGEAILSGLYGKAPLDATGKVPVNGPTPGDPERTAAREGSADPPGAGGGDGSGGPAGES